MTVECRQTNGPRVIIVTRNLTSDDPPMRKLSHSSEIALMHAFRAKGANAVICCDFKVFIIFQAYRNSRVCCLVILALQGLWRANYWNAHTFLLKHRLDREYPTSASLLFWACRYLRWYVLYNIVCFKLICTIFRYAWSWFDELCVNFKKVRL